MQDITEIDLKNKKIIVRVDLNVPLIHGKVIDSERILRIQPTIKYLIDQEAKVILISHFGRPKGEFNVEMSLAPIVDELQKFLPNIPVKFSVDCQGEMAKEAVDNLNYGEVLILENLRFYPEETKNDEVFAKELASFADIYINDSFSSSHRSHASIDAITKFLPSYPGLLLKEEIDNLNKYLTSPKDPMIAIIGGSKVSTKIELIKHISNNAEAIIIGGAMANTFLAAKNIDVKSSLIEKDYLSVAKEIITFCDNNNCEIILPMDACCAKDIKDGENSIITSIDKIPDDYMILDIGPNSILEILSLLDKYKTILWNGPLGAFEFKPFNIGTEAIARKIALLSRENNLISIAGGGDVVASVKSSGLKNEFTYISTAGGAFLAWLEGKSLPGIKALIEN